MWIGQLANVTGTTAKAVRLYEQLGLLGSVPRHGNYRVYGEQHVKRVLLIRRAASLGFKLADLAPFLTNDDGPNWLAMAERINQQMDWVESEIQRLQQQRDALIVAQRDIHECIRATCP